MKIFIRKCHKIKGKEVLFKTNSGIIYITSIEMWK